MNFFSKFLQLPYKLAFAIQANPIGMFIYGIFAKWYIVVTIASMLVLYWVLNGLQQVGILDAAFDTMVQAFATSKAIAQNCTPKILNLNSFWSCISDPGAYKEAVGEKELNSIGDQLQNLFDQNQQGKQPKPQNPYAD